MGGGGGGRREEDLPRRRFSRVRDARERERDRKYDSALRYFALRMNGEAVKQPYKVPNTKYS